MSDFTDFTYQHQHGMSDYTLPAMENYLMHGFHPGSFLMAVLKNDLAAAVGRADTTNFANLGNIVKWMVYNVPEAARGNCQRVHDWLMDKDGIRTAYATECEKAFAWHLLQNQPA